MRECSSCGSSYEHYGQRCSFCRECKRIYDREYHRNRSEDSKKRKIGNQRKRALEIKKCIYDYLKENPCSSCGEDDIVVLEFDHIDPDIKKMDISNMLKVGYSLNNIMLEIGKCRVLCANCHRRHTSNQFSWFKEEY